MNIQIEIKLVKKYLWIADGGVADGDDWIADWAMIGLQIGDDWIADWRLQIADCGMCIVFLTIVGVRMAMIGLQMGDCRCGMRIVFWRLGYGWRLSEWADLELEADD